MAYNWNQSSRVNDDDPPKCKFVERVLFKKTWNGKWDNPLRRQIHHFQEMLAITGSSGAGPAEEQDEIKNPAIRASVSADEGEGQRGEDLKIQDPGATYRGAGE